MRQKGRGIAAGRRAALSGIKAGMGAAPRSLRNGV
jgi:hypothetical protein